VKEGSLFVALRGPRFDGHAFVAQALEDGATAALVEREHLDAVHAGVPHVAVDDTLIALGQLARWHRDRFAGPVVAITGSCGKSTTKELTAAVLATRWRVHKTSGNLNNLIGVPLTLLALDAEHEAAVVEAGISEPGEMDKLAAIIAPTVRVVLNAGVAHVEQLRDAAGVAREKAKLFDGARADDALVYNVDDALVRAEAEQRDAGRRVGFGLAAQADVRARDVQGLGAEGSTFRLLTPDGEADVHLQLAGEHNVANALAAAAIGHALGLSAAEIATGLSASTEGMAGRSSIVRLDSGVTLIDDTYNSNPQSAQAALRLLVSLRQPKGRAIAVLGDMLELGEHGERAHREVGRTAAELGIDLLLALGDSSRFTVEAARAARVDAKHFEDVQALSDALRAAVEAGDVVLVKGSRGMRMERARDALMPDAAG
jgi:UDP-N-acetylmuramoyl-tripeptide--D-alanyl-D-alanine ligase